MVRIGGSPKPSRRTTPDRLDRPWEDPLLYDLFPALATSVEWDLGRAERALELLGDPHTTYASLHVGGTNGKGSVTAMLASVMRASGRRSGCYLSPHLVSFRERILVDGRPVAEDALRAYAAETREAVATCGLTFFEAATVLALHIFEREGVEVAALEVGLGGRLDATNVARPEVSAVTNVAMDHADYLGDTLLQIAGEKAGIMKSAVPFVTTETDADVLALFRARADELGTTVWSVSPDALNHVCVEPNRTAFLMTSRRWGALEVVTPLAGRHQATNAALAVEVCAHLPDDLRPTREDLLSGIADVRYHGRDELVVAEGGRWLFDVAHNAAGVGSLVDTLDRLDVARPLVALVGVLGDKDWAAMLPPLLARCERAVLTQPPTAPPGRRWDPSAVADALRVDDALDPGIDVSMNEDFTEALREAAYAAGAGTVIVTGSVHTVGGAMRILGVDPLDE